MPPLLKKTIVTLNLGLEEDFEQALLEKILLCGKEDETIIKLFAPGEKPFVATLIKFQENGGKTTFMLKGSLVVEKYIHEFHIANATDFGGGKRVVESFIGRGAQVRDLFRDVRVYGGIIPVEIGLYLRRFIESPERKTLEEIYKACDPEKLALWAQKSYKIPAPQEKCAVFMSEQDAIEFTRRYGRPPFANKTNNYEIVQKKPLEAYLFGQTAVLFGKNEMPTGGSFSLVNVSDVSIESPTKKGTYKKGSYVVDFALPNGQKETVSIYGAPCYDLLGESMAQIAKDFPPEEYLKRVFMAAENEFPNDMIFLVERILSRAPDKRLKEDDLKILAGMLAGTIECRLEKKTFVSSKDNSSHELLVATMSKLFPVVSGDNRVSRKKGNFVLSDNGELLKGRFVLGGDDSLREALVKRQMNLVEIDRPLENGLER